MTLVLLTQYLDTLKEIGARANSNTWMLSDAPGEMRNPRDQISQAIAVGDRIGDPVGKKARLLIDLPCLETKGHWCKSLIRLRNSPCLPCSRC
jgi:hypothetical protein